MLLSLICLSLLPVPLYAADAGEDAANTATAMAPRNDFDVTFNDVEDAVASALNEKGISDKVSVTVTGRRSTPIFSYSQPVSVTVKGLQVGQTDHRWSASLLFVAGNDVISALPASGHFSELIEIPVLKRQVRNGDIITAQDIEIRDFPLMHTRTDTITDLAALIGKSPIHSISASRPIREQEVSAPVLVKRNALVSIRYSSPGMEITTTGEALDSGAQGDVINVRNTTSKKIVRAAIADNNTVDIIAPGTETTQVARNDYATN